MFKAIFYLLSKIVYHSADCNQL